MKKIRKTRLFAVIAAILLCGMLLVGLASCAGAPDKTEVDWDPKYNEDHAEYFKLLLETNADAYVKFVAASRGYDMNAEGYDDERYTEFATEDRIGAAQKALDAVRPENAAYAEKFDEYKAALTEDEIASIVLRLQTKVDLDTKKGPIDTILTWIGKFLKALTKITAGSYIFALFIFAVIIEIVLLPFGIKQRKDSIKQARFRPKEMAIRKKYAGRTDQASMRKMQEEIQRLYQEAGFNPMGGCLPLLIQLPIVIALYQIVVDPLRYVFGKVAALSNAVSTYVSTARAAGGLGQSVSSSRGTIELLSKLTEGNNLDGLKNFAFFSNSEACYNALVDVGSTKLNFNLFGGNMGEIPTITRPSLLWLVPVVTFVVYFISMKVNRKLSYQPATVDQQTGCSNNVMDITMPLMSVYISFIVPAAVGIYWIFKSLIGMLKQYILHVSMPLPTFTEEDYKAAERELKGKRPEKREPGVRTTSSGKQVRSLHHIDDEDDELPPPAKDPVEKKTENKPAPTDNKEKGISTAPLKEDRKNEKKKDK